MKNRTWRDEGKRDPIGGPKSTAMKRANKNQKPKDINRGLSLEAFTSAKSNTNHYNPALIKKQKEFYKNAKYVSKFKKSIKRESQQSDLSTDRRPDEDDDNKREKTSEMNKRNKKSMYKGKYCLGEIYKKRHEEEEKARIEREAIIRTKKEEREKAQAKKKAIKKKMNKKTRSGQPVMKYRIERLLESIQGSQSKS